MMFTIRVAPTLLFNRINAEANAPELVENARILERCGIGLQTLGAQVTAPINNSIRDIAGELDAVGGTIPMFRPADIDGFFVSSDSAPKLTAAFEAQHEKARVHPGDIVLAVAGTVAAAGRVPSWVVHGNVNGSCARIKPEKDVDGYLLAYLNTIYGFRSLMRLAVGSVQKHLNLEDLPELTIARPTEKALIHIGQKIEQADRLKAHARQLEASIASKFSFLTSSLLPLKKAWWASQTDVDAYRINAPHYDAVVLDMLEKARAATGLVSLQSLIGPREIAGGATPLGAEYPPDGIFFVRVQNVKPYRLDLSDAAYLDVANDEELKRSRCAESDVILSITGYPGTASIVMGDDLPVNINQHSVRFEIVGDFSSEFVTAALNSPFLKKQVDRLAIGGTREALDYTSVGNLQIPVLPKLDRDEITAWVSTSNRCVRAATRLTAASKILVEALIEGKVTEAQLVAAQEALERGDDSFDRALLRRLTRHGLDVVDQPPLFPDLDALYALLAQTREGIQ